MNRGSVRLSEISSMSGSLGTKELGINIEGKMGKKHNCYIRGRMMFILNLILQRAFYM